jgi:hypothetical protein
LRGRPHLASLNKRLQKLVRRSGEPTKLRIRPTGSRRRLTSLSVAVAVHPHNRRPPPRHHRLPALLQPQRRPLPLRHGQPQRLRPDRLPRPTSTAQPAPTTPATPAGANEFSTEAQAKAHCPSDTVVWVTLNSKIYHFSGTRYYGNTKNGAYMCERDTAAAGMRAAKNETHP